MLGVLCARPRPPPCFLSSLSFSSSASSLHRLLPPPTRSDAGDLSLPPRRGAAASVWHTILPSFRTAVLSRHEHGALIRRGEGSWNVAWDTRPARWLHHPNSAWLLFGVCSSAPPSLVDDEPDSISEPVDVSVNDSSSNYRVTGVTADGRCLFRAIAHMACLRNGDEAPDENLQRELADKLRAQVVEELMKRRKEVEWFMEEEFDVYVKRIQQPYAWGGEPELLMCSHVLRRPISVYMKDRSSSSLIKIANYGEEYRRTEENSIDVLFHGLFLYAVIILTLFAFRMDWYSFSKLRTQEHGLVWFRYTWDTRALNYEQGKDIEGNSICY